MQNLKILKGLIIAVGVISTLSGCATTNSAEEYASAAPEVLGTKDYNHYIIKTDDTIRTTLSISNKHAQKAITLNDGKGVEKTFLNPNVTFEMYLTETNRTFPVEVLDKDTGYDVDAFYFVKYLETDNGAIAELSNKSGCRTIVSNDDHYVEACGIEIKRL